MADPPARSSADLIPPLHRAFLRGDYAAIDPQLPGMLQVLADAGAGECWHKRSTFKSHLLEVYRILKCWGADDATCRCALFHSAYSNSFVNLAIFKPDTDRAKVAAIIGPEAEQLTHLFCIVPRQQLIQRDLLDKLPLGTADLQAPAGGMTVPHIRTGERVHVDLFHLGLFLLLTMADFAEQLYGWQDAMFGNDDGRLCLEGCPHPEPRMLWPGPMQPGLWMSAVSRMGRLLVSCKQQLEAAGDPRGARLPVPPVFDACSRVLPEADQAAARDAYWQVAANPALQGPQHAAQLRTLLQRACELNPWAAEPRLMLAQLALHEGRWGDAADDAAAALRTFLAWSTAWDKRVSFDVFVSWARVCLEAAEERRWCDTPLQVLSKGLVGGL